LGSADFAIFDEKRKFCKTQILSWGIPDPLKRARLYDDQVIRLAYQQLTYPEISKVIPCEQ
jgi:hypothetical protein